MPRFFVLCAALLAASAVFAQRTHSTGVAQAYPQKPIRYIVPFPAGGIADVFARIIGGRIAESWGQPVLVENRAGAGGNIGAELVAKSAPDGYTILMGSIGTQALNASLYRNMPYDSAKDFTPAAPEFPALAETLTGFEVNNWVGTFGPAGMPAAITAKLNAEILAVMRAPEVQQRLLTEGARFTPMTPARFAEFVAAETAKWGKLIREVGIRAD